MEAEFRDCPDCGSSHLGPRCGMTFRQRLRSVRLDPRIEETKTKRNYYDVDAVHQAFGEDARDELMEDTDGWGAAKREPDGSFSRIDWKGVKHVVSDADLMHYVGGEEADDVV